MLTVKTTPQFDRWIAFQPDRLTVIRLKKRLDKMARGLWGDAKLMGGGVFELREHFGPGWRMYYAQRDQIVVASGRHCRSYCTFAFFGGVNFHENFRTSDL